MREDSGVQLSQLRVDGGMVVNGPLMQFQADILGIPVVRPKVIETTSLGAAYAAGLAIGIWSGTGTLRNKWVPQNTWQPSMELSKRNALYAGWRKALERSYLWA
jgi:glycerol kinase